LNVNPADPNLPIPPVVCVFVFLTKE
jgi:hypothetical protein